MTLRFYFDEDSMNRALIRALQDRGIDVENAIDAGQEAKYQLIEAKSQAGRAKDRAALPLLNALLRRQEDEAS